MPFLVPQIQPTAALSDSLLRSTGLAVLSDGSFKGQVGQLGFLEP